MGAVEAAGGTMESQDDFVARCTRETLAANPEAQGWVGDACRQRWESVVASGPMVEAILAAAPARPEPVDPASLPSRLAMVQWNASPEGTLVAQGRLGDLDVQVESPPRISFYWGEVGALIPYDAVEALRGRGAQVSLVGCMGFGTGEANQVFRVDTAGRAPFALGLYSRAAPTADANSFYNVSVDLSGVVSTLADLRARDGDDWAETCARE
jgi:hypothetical protein